MYTVMASFTACSIQVCVSQCKLVKELPLPPNGGFDGINNLLDSIADLWTDSVAGNKRYSLNLGVSRTGYVDQCASLHSFQELRISILLVA